MRYLAALALCTLPLAAPAQTAQEERDRGFLTGLIEDNLSSVSREVTILGFEGALSSRATIQTLTIADAEGIWFRAEGLALDWDRGAVLGGRIEVNEMSAEAITLLRPPVSEPQPPDPEAAPFALPELPVAINIAEIRAETITLGAPLLGEEIVVTLDGAVALEGGEGTARITADRLNGDGRFVIAGSYSNTTRNLDLTLDLAEDRGGLVVRLLDLSGRPSVDLSIDGSGPISDFAADLTLATDGVQRLTGAFGLVQRTDDQGRNRLDLAFDLGGDVGAMLPDDYAAFFGDDVSLALRVERQDDGAVRLRDLDIDAEALQVQGSAELSPDGWPLRLDLGLRIAARDGAPVLLPLGGERTLVTSAEMTVDYDSAAGDLWNGDFTLRGLERPGLTVPLVEIDGGGSIVPRQGDTPGRFDAAVAYAASGIAFDDPALARAVGERIAGRLEVARDGEEPFRIDTLTVEGPGLALSAEGRIAVPEGGPVIATTARLDAAALDRFAGLAGLEGLEGAAGLTIVSTLRPLSGAFDIDLAGQTTDLALGVAPLDPLIAGRGTLSLAAIRDANGTRVPGLTIETPLTTLTAAATLTSSGSDGRFDLVLRDLSQALPGLAGAGRLSGTATQDATGLVSLAADAELPRTRLAIDASVLPGDGPATVRAEVTGEAEDLAPFSALAGRDLGGAVRLRATGGIRTDLAEFSLVLDARTIDLALDVGRLDPLLRGDATLTGAVARTGPQTFALDDIMLRAPAVGIDLTGRFADGGGSADFGVELVDLSLVEPRLSGGAMLAGAVLRDAGGATTLDALLTGPGGAVAKLDGTLPAGAEPVAEGRVVATLADLSPYSRLAGRTLSGAVDTVLSGRASLDLATLALDFDLDGRDLVAGGIALTGGVSATGRAERDAFGGGVLDLSATGPGDTAITLAAQATPLDETFEITTDIDLTAGSLRPYSGLAGRPLGGAATLAVDGTLRADATRFDLSVNGETTNIDVGIPPLATVLQGTGTFRTRASRGSAGGITLKGVRVAYPNLTAAGSLDGRGGSGSGAFNARLADIGLFTPELSGPVTAQGTAALNADGSWSTETNATGPGGIRATVAGTVAGGNALNLRIDGVAPLGIANAYIEPRRLQGEARFDLSVVGPAALSSVSGQVRIPGARLAAPTLGRAFEDLSGTIDLRAGRADVALSTRAEAGGTFGLDGSVGLTGGLEADLEITGRDLVERDPNLYETTVNLNLGVTGPLAGGARIAGTVTLGDTEIRVPSSDLSGLGALPEVRHVGADAEVRRTLARAGLTTDGTDAASAEGNGSGRPYPIDISVEAPARLFVRGRGLDAELGGAVRLGGTTAQVIPSGRFSLIRGRLDILQQRFDLDEGSITLEGDFTPFISLVASTTARDGTLIRIIIEGPASEPVVTFASTPELPQDEVLSRLIFDQPLDEITPFQAVQLAAAVSTLAGRGGGGLIDGFRTDLGLDDLDITTDDDGDVAVRAGKYLTENVYTDVTVGSDRTEIELNLDLTDDITITGRANSDGETGLGIFFERDY